MPLTRPSEQRSLFGEILDWMLAPLLLLWPMSIVLTYLVAQNIADRPFDRELATVVRAIARQISIEPAAGDALRKVRLQMPALAAEFLRGEEDVVYYQLLGARGEFVAGDAGLPVPEDARQANGEVHFRVESMRDEPVRVAYLWLPVPGAADDSALLIQVAETLEKRSQLATEIIKGVILPQFVILPLAVVLVWFALSRGIKPLDRLQQRIRRRESTDLSPIDDHDVPDEVAQLVRSTSCSAGSTSRSVRRSSSSPTLRTS
jgi:two-component system, OmpR family, sensor histidine kinase TctE